QSFFDGIDTTIPALFKAIRRPAPAGAGALLASIDAEVKAAIRAFSLKDPSASVPALARGLAATRKAIAQLTTEPDAMFILDIKERQSGDAINTALGIELQATAQAPASPEGATMGPVVPGQKIEVRAVLTNRGT